MHISLLQYDLPPELIAQQPAADRDQSRLMVVRARTGDIEHRRFADIVDLLRPQDCLVVNNTRVLPARFFARRKTGGKVEALFLREIEPGRWELLLQPSGRLRPGERLSLGASLPELILETRGERGSWTAQVEPAAPAVELLERIGQTPLPPYIHRQSGPAGEDRDRYQTVYAREPGAVAAPTAGLHFSPKLLRELRNCGVAVAELTLHVGPGTFQPIDCQDLRDHPMHAEWYRLPAETVAAIQDCRTRGGRIAAVGTTSARVLETCGRDGTLRPGHGFTNLFIYPPYQFRQVDALLTNFHLPGSTLLAMVQAFAGRELIMAAYAQAIRQRYRFYSYGDAMLIV